MLNLEFVQIRTGPPSVSDEILQEPRDVKRVSFARELLDSAKFHITSYNARRAVLDLAGSFEAFVAEAEVARSAAIKRLRSFDPAPLPS
jgi:hypothetical protein